MIVGQKKKIGRSAQGWLALSNVNKDVDIFKVGESDMPF